MPTIYLNYASLRLIPNRRASTPAIMTIIIEIPARSKLDEDSISIQFKIKHILNPNTSKWGFFSHPVMFWCKENFPKRKIISK
tara:strand:- start:218 stop:466 length:249 start_codon:yes stop_codon:yes gene_type:complete